VNSNLAFSGTQEDCALTKSKRPGPPFFFWFRSCAIGLADIEHELFLFPGSATARRSRRFNGVRVAHGGASGPIHCRPSRHTTMYCPSRRLRSSASATARFKAQGAGFIIVCLRHLRLQL
jgi:hypothetical protein